MYVLHHLSRQEKSVLSVYPALFLGSGDRQSWVRIPPLLLVSRIVGKVTLLDLSCLICEMEMMRPVIAP